MPHSDKYEYEQVTTTATIPKDAESDGVGGGEDNDGSRRARRRKRARPTSDYMASGICGTSRPMTCLAVGICIGLFISVGYLRPNDSDQGRASAPPLHPPITSHSSSKDGFDDSVDVDVDRYCRNKSRKECPPISKFVKGYKVRGNVEWLLDFAVVGSAKCGTSFLLRYLGNSSETLMPKYEVCKMSKNRPDELVQLYYNASLVAGKYHRKSSSATPADDNKDDAHDVPAPAKVINGLKCPKSLGTQLGVANFAKYFPNMKYIVTMRHPVKWFQSFYNYRVYGNGKLPPPRELIGSCVDDSPYICSKRCAVKTHTQNVCTDRAKFHHQLSRFGKTPMNTKEENDLLVHDMDIVPSNGTIFLMDIAQLFPSEKASRFLARDLSKFLGLQKQLPSLEDVPPDSSRYTDPERTKYFINICDNEHRQLREILVDIGKDAYIWIRDYFLDSPDVMVSSKEDFLDLISKWQYDPCADEDYNKKA